MEHISVMLETTVSMLNITGDGIYVDGTLGRAGHSSEILKRLTTGHLYSFDIDQQAIDESREKLERINNNFTLIKANFADMQDELNSRSIYQVDGVLLDIGVSSPQFDDPDRGFSYRYDSRLDMRMDQRQSKSAWDVVNRYSESELFHVIQNYGEDRFAKNIARHIVSARADHTIETTGELIQIIKASIPARVRASGGHPAKRTFQAIRIEVNSELDVLENSLEDMIDLLRDGGRICVITFHSLEDRIVKNIFRRAADPCTCPKSFPVCVCGKKPKGRVITGKPIIPSQLEMEENPRSKSAKLRVFERITV